MKLTQEPLSKLKIHILFSAIVLCILILISVFSGILIKSTMIRELNMNGNAITNRLIQIIRIGKMSEFRNHLQQEARMENVLDISLFNRQGKLYQSTNPDSPSAGDEKGIFSFTRSDGRELTVQNHLNTEADCIRCHPGWELNRTGATLSLTFDLAPLKQTVFKLSLIILTGGLLLLLAGNGFVYFLLHRTRQTDRPQPTPACTDEV